MVRGWLLLSLGLAALPGCKTRPLFGSAQTDHQAPHDLARFDGDDRLGDAFTPGSDGDGGVVPDGGKLDLATPPDLAPTKPDGGGGGGGGPHTDPLLCGNGMLDFGEQCDDGVFNGVLQITLSQTGHQVRTVGPIIHEGDVLDYYKYAANSSHIGNELADEGRLFLYYDPTTHIGSFVISNGADDPEQEPAHVKLTLDVSFQVDIAICDGADDECVAIQTEFGAMFGDWTFGGQTAGAILRGVPLTSAMTILVSPDFESGMHRWSYIDATGKRIALDMDKLTYVRAEPDTETCKLDCTNPK